MTTKTTATGPYRLGLPDPEPAPVDGCDECGGFAKDRGTARRDGDLSKVSDLNVLMRAHQSRGCA